MYSLHGNMVLTLGYLNCSGLKTPGRLRQLIDSEVDVLCLTETHADSHLCRALEEGQDRRRVVCGAPVPRHDYAGVCVMARRECTWRLKQVPFAVGSACAKYFNMGRLLLVEWWHGAGREMLHLYVIYGHANARWNDPLKSETHRILEAAHADMMSRGTPAIIGGDFNLTVGDRFGVTAMGQARGTIRSQLSVGDSGRCY